MAGHHETPDVDDVTGIETTGHEWDGIKELNNPLPRWWLWIFYASIVWSIIYMIFMPAIPGLPGMAGATPGIRNHSERINVRNEMEALQASRADLFAQLANSDVHEIDGDPTLRNFALAAGESAFGDNCSTCHGSGAAGADGYPNLNDDVWLWGGTYEDIRHTLRYGIRTEHPETRFSLMPAFGQDGLLSAEEVDNLVQYVLSLSNAPDVEYDAAAAREASAVYQAQCVSCHGADGQGDRAQGAPNLTDADWLYGRWRDRPDPEAIRETIWGSRYGLMPYWSDRLDEATIDALAYYVHARGGGE